MQNSDSLFDMLFRMVLKTMFTPDKSGPQDNRAENQMLLALLGLLAFVGADALKVVFRKNFGKKGLNMLRVVLSFIAFLLIAGIAFHLSGPEVEIDSKFGTHLSYKITGYFYVLLGFYVLITGIRHKKMSRRQQFHPEYRGDSDLLSTLIHKSGWSQLNVQNLAEPIVALVFGGLLASINLLWGLPVVFCALSVWGNLLMDYLFDINPVQERMQQQGYQGRNNNFTNVQ